MITPWFILMILLAVDVTIILVIYTSETDTFTDNKDCYDKSVYKCRQCHKDCKWYKIVRAYEDVDK